MPPAENDCPLPPNCAFVVQFRADSEPGSGPCAGRVEHVTSGRLAHFESADDLLRFMAQTLCATRSAGGG